jgi:dTDP-4-dehydrorhamnose reductase
MKWGVIGFEGLFGTEFEEHLKRRGQSLRGFNRSNLDLNNSPPELTLQVSSQGQFDVLVNCIAYTGVDKAESEPDQAMLVNGEYAGKLALVAKNLGARFVHISTDYVFDGTYDSPYQPHHKTNPQSAYGRSKLAGEIAVQESGADYQIFRTAWLYGANGPCFPKTVQRVLGQTKSMKVVADQVGQPTWTLDLAKLIIAHSKLDQSARPRIVHATASGQASWFDFACEIATSLGYDSANAVLPITTADYPTPAKRPAYSVLDNQNETGLVIGDWRERWQEAAGLVLGK